MKRTVFVVLVIITTVTVVSTVAYLLSSWSLAKVVPHPSTRHWFVGSTGIHEDTIDATDHVSDDENARLRDYLTHVKKWTEKHSYDGSPFHDGAKWRDGRSIKQSRDNVTGRVVGT